MPRTVTQMQDIPKNDDFLAASARFVGKTRVYPDEAEEECEAALSCQRKENGPNRGPFVSQKPSIPFTQNILGKQCYAMSGFFRSGGNGCLCFFWLQCATNCRNMIVGLLAEA